MALEPQPAAPTAALPAPALSHALDLLWERFKPEIEQRVAVLESAAAAEAAHSLSGGELEAAQSAAHKLAGVLGSFGLAEGTAMAREIETICSTEAPTASAGADRFLSLAAQLRAIVESRAALSAHPK